MNTPRAGLGIVVLASAALLAGCEGTTLFHSNPDAVAVADDDYVTTEKPIQAVDLESLWERGQEVAGNRGYGVDETRSKFADRLLVTRWKAVMAVVRFEGYRTRAWMKFKETKKQGEWNVSVAVQRQRNADIDRPDEPSVARWEEVAADKALADVLLYQIEAAFRPTPGGE